MSGQALHVRAEKPARRREEGIAERLGTIKPPSLDATVNKTLDGVVMGWSEAVARLFGYRQEEMQGQSIRRIIPPDRQHEEDHFLAKIAAGEGIQQFETIRLHKNGAPISVAVTVSPMKDASGKIVGATTIIRDQSHRHQAEMLLHEAEARLASEASALRRLNDVSSRLWLAGSLREGLQEMLSASIELLGADKGNIQLIDASRHVLTIAAQQGFAHAFLDFFSEVSVRDDSACGRALRSGERIIIEDVEADEGYAPFRKVAAEAGYRAVQTTPIMGRDGNPLGMLSAHFAQIHRPSEQELNRLDLYVRQAGYFIERWHADKALRESEQRYRGVYEHAGTGIAITDTQGRYLACNPAYAKMLGYREGELLGLDLPSLVHAEDRATNWLEMERLVAQDIPEFETLNRYVGKSGQTIWVHKHVSLMKDEKGRPTNIVALVTDITERKLAEERIHLLMREVNHRAKNMLAVVQAIACQTIAATPDGFLLRFGERVHALATSQDLLVKHEFC